MRNRLIPLILVLALILSVALTACGEKEDSASPDSAIVDESATADESATGVSSSASSASSGSSSKSDSAASSQVSSDASSSGDVASSPAAVTPQQDNAGQNDADNGGSGQQADPEPENNDEGSSKQASSKSISQKSSSSNSASSAGPNPAYSDDDRPNFKIVLTNKKTKKEYSAACSYKKDNDNLAYAAFFLPGGEYDIAVYEYADQIDKDHPLATSTYKNDIDENKRRSIHVNYTSDDKKIEVKEITSSRTQ